MNQFKVKVFTRNVLRAISIMCAAAPVISYAQSATDIGTVSASGTSATQNAAVTEASKVAVSQGSLEARSAQSTVSDKFVRDFTSPVSDYSQVFQITPGAFSYSPNGVGQGNAGTTIRGLTDSQYLVTFDGIPFNDTNGVSHHSYVYFPAQVIGSAVVDRSPGSASTIGQATFGGSLNLYSRTLDSKEGTSVTGSYGTWKTSLIDLQHQSGAFGQDATSSAMFDIQKMSSDGYQTYNFQNRDAISGKYQYIYSPDTLVTFFGSWENVKNNQANATSTLTQLRQYGDNFLNSNDPTQATYYGYNFYNVTTTFAYVGVQSNLGDGWKLDDKIYNYSYHNKQNYPGATLPVAAGNVPATAQNPKNDSGTDKLNAYHTFGNLLRLSKDTTTGTFRTGLWTEIADSNRYQTPQNPLTLADGPTPNFNETYQTYTIQPYVEYEYKVTDDLKVTGGVKYASYKQDYTHLQDLKKVGYLGGTLNKTTNAIVGGLPSIDNTVSYSDILPSLDAHYLIRPNWSAYAQIAAGDLIPPTSVFDVPNAQVATPPKAQKSTTVQVGTVWKSDGFTFDVDAYHVKLDNSYSSITDSVGNLIYTATGTEITQGIEAETTIPVAYGWSVYLNGTLGTTKYSGGSLDGHWVAGAPADTETLGLFYTNANWNSALIAKRVGKLYNDGATSGSDSYVINPVVLTNMFINYVIKNPVKYTKQAKVQLAINNLFDKHSITAIGGTGADANPSGSYAGLAGADTVATLPARSVALTLTVDF
jgi:iron complex outermembrane receptor protein